jgi:hypothetical protein
MRGAEVRLEQGLHLVANDLKLGDVYIGNITPVA